MEMCCGIVNSVSRSWIDILLKVFLVSLINRLDSKTNKQCQIVSSVESTIEFGPHIAVHWWILRTCLTL